MKKLASVSFAVMCIYVLSACSGAATKDQGTKRDDGLVLNTSNRIALRVEGEGEEAKLIIVPGESSTQCREPEKGCITSLRRELVKAVFQLERGDSRKWHFSRFKICLEDEQVLDPNVDCKLDVFDRLEFGAVSKKEETIASPNAKGVIKLSRLKEGNDLHRFIVANQNSKKQSFFYWVEVCRDDKPGLCRWNEDPHWRNLGR